MKSVLMTLLMAVGLSGAARADNPILLPSGEEIKDTSFDFHPNWYATFPERNPACVEKYPGGNLLAVHGQTKGKLDGTTAVLYEGGHLKILLSYSVGRRQGPLRVWDASSHMLLYSDYKENKKNGTLCLFSSGTPRLVQEWKNGNMENEALLSFAKDKGYTSLKEKALSEEQSQQFGRAKARLSKLETVLADYETEWKSDTRKWYSNIDKRIKDAQAKILGPVRMAQANAKKQAKAEAEARADEAAAQAVNHGHPVYHGVRGVYGSYAAAHNANRAIGAATAANHKLAYEDHVAADENLRSANANAAATQRAAVKVTERLNAEVAADFKNQRDFVVGALEKSLVSDRTDTGDQ